MQTCKLDLTQEDLIANCVFGEPKSEAYIVLNRPLGSGLVNAAITEADEVLLACSSMFMNGLTENV